MKRGAKSDGVNIIGAKLVAGDVICEAPIPPPVLPVIPIVPEVQAPTDDPNTADTFFNFDEPLVTQADVEVMLSLTGTPQSIELSTSNVEIKSIEPKVENFKQFFQIGNNSLLVLVPKNNFFRKNAFI